MARPYRLPAGWHSSMDGCTYRIEWPFFPPCKGNPILPHLPIVQVTIPVPYIGWPCQNSFPRCAGVCGRPRRSRSPLVGLALHSDLDTSKASPGRVRCLGSLQPPVAGLEKKVKSSQICQKGQTRTKDGTTAWESNWQVFCVVLKRCG